MLSDEDLRSMTAQEIANLQSRLRQATADLPGASPDGERRRRFLLVVVATSALGLTPWVAFLAATLPRHYVAGHWRLTWVGFDTALIAALALTAYLAWRRRHAVIVVGFLTSALLTCDAWFDVTTSRGGADRIVSFATAILVELPLAGLLFLMARNLLAALARSSRAAQGHTDKTLSLLRLELFARPNDDGPTR